MLNILYLVHDLQDPATRRRTKMLEAGGAQVTVAGFHRGELTAGDARISFGHTEDGNFAQRVAAILKAATNLGRLLRGVSKPDCIVARNLEMLVLAHRAAAYFGNDAIPVVYECLDIHRLLLRNDAIGSGLRLLERRLAKRASLLITSSPAFVSEYFQPLGQFSASTLIVENRVIDLAAETANPLPQRALKAGPPWSIGWFGALRCIRSLAILAQLSREMEGRVEVILRGRPAMRELPGFRTVVSNERHLSFRGPYRNPEDMAAIYGQVHFVWAIDFFEEGQNSEWLLPNRLYEGCRFGAIPIALKRTEVGKYLARKGIGVLLDEATPYALSARLNAIQPTDYVRYQERLASIEPSTWVCTARDCRNLVEQISRLRPLTPSFETVAIDRRTA